MENRKSIFQINVEPYKVFFDSLEIPCFFSSFSALDRFFGLPCGRFLEVVTGSSLVEVARAFDGLEFPGLPGIDAVVSAEGLEEPGDLSGKNKEDDERFSSLLIACQLENGRLDVPRPESPGLFGAFLYSPSARRFYDPDGVYPVLRGKEPLTPARLGLAGAVSWEPWLRAAVLLSRYPLRLAPEPAGPAGSEREKEITGGCPGTA